MKRLGDIVAARGLDRIELLDPLEPEHVRQLYLPGHDLLFGCAPENTPDALPPEQLFALKPGRKNASTRTLMNCSANGPWSSFPPPKPSMTGWKPPTSAAWIS